MTNLKRFARRKSLARVMAMLFGGILLLVALSGLVLSMRSWNRSFTPAARFFCLLCGIIALIVALKLFKVF
jgi:hypothetical protein